MSFKPKAVIVDRDGTLARINREFVESDRPDWASFNSAMVFDTAVPAVVALVNSIDPDIKVLVTTGRGEAFRHRMMDWLTKHGIRCDHLIMRKHKDQRRDDHVKRDLYHEYIEPYYDVQFVVDDRPIVCDMWRELGLPLIQVSQPEELPTFEWLVKDA